PIEYERREQGMNGSRGFEYLLNDFRGLELENDDKPISQIQSKLWSVLSGKRESAGSDLNGYVNGSIGKGSGDLGYGSWDGTMPCDTTPASGRCHNPVTCH